MLGLVALFIPTGVGAESNCGDFTPGGACHPNDAYRTLLDKSSEASCRAACEAERVQGCCWHQPSGTDNSCQWVVGGQAAYFGEEGVRSAARCEGLPFPPSQPEQLHIAYGVDPSQMVLAWATKGRTTDDCRPVAQWGEKDASMGSWAFADTIPGSAYDVHRATLEPLIPGSFYEYMAGWNCSSGDAPWSEPTLFRAQLGEDNLDEPVRLAMFGDLGYTDDQILPTLGEESRAGAVDAIVLYGDMVYWRDVPNAWPESEAYAAFMRDVSGMSGGGSVPFFVCPGNGESGGNYSFYRSNFFMPGYQQYASLWHSFDLGRAHIVGVNSQALQLSDEVVTRNMLAWLRADLETATSQERRANRPWIIVHFHHPVYSENYGSYADGGGDAKARLGFEQLMYEFGVDLVFAGHVHNQELTFPVVNGSVRCGDTADCFRDAGAPVYVVSGNPGNTEEANVIEAGFQEYTRWRSYGFGYTHLDVVNESYASVDFLSTNLGGQIVETVELRKTRACNFGSACTSTSATRARRRHSVAEGSIAPAFPRPSFLRLQETWRHRVADEVGLVPAIQVAALVKFFRSTGGVAWRRSDNWLSGDPCRDGWYGVGCVKVTDRMMPELWEVAGITALQLPSNDLAGQLPDLSALAPTLQLVDLSANLLTGTVHQSLWHMPKLHSLFLEPKLDFNESIRLTGTLPADLGASSGLPNLRFLSLNRNNFHGPLPASLGQANCTVTQASPVAPSCNWWFMNNSFDGPIPQELCTPVFGEVYLSHNNFSCPHPTCITADYMNQDPCPSSDYASLV